MFNFGNKDTILKDRNPENYLRSKLILVCA